MFMTIIGQKKNKVELVGVSAFCECESLALFFQRIVPCIKGTTTSVFQRPAGAVPT
jgi:hypothetical protein